MKCSKKLYLLLILCLLSEQVICRRSGGFSSTFGRGNSGARSSGSLGRNTGMGGHRGSGTSNIGGYNRGTGAGYSSGRHVGGGSVPQNYGSRSSGGGIIGNRGGYNNRGTSSGNRGILGGFGSGGRHSNYGRPSSGRGFGSTFKNVIVGAAAGYLAYQGGKYLIRNAMAPMMYNNRPYYWGSSYYQSRPNTQMCRMPVEANDANFGNIYFQDQSRPRELVWGCGMHEHCCGYECCPNGMSGMGGGVPMGGGAIPMGGGMPAGGVSSLPSYCKVDGTGIDLSLRPAQSVGVRGNLKCNGVPASGVLVKLYDHDTFTLDDLIAEGRTDAQGNFCIAGHANEITRITPKFNIYHDCNDFLPCQRKLSMYIPQNFVSSGQVPYNIYDSGVVELSGKFEGESRDCLHK